VIVLASAGDWVSVALFVGLLLCWWTFLAWWISRYGGREVSVTFESSDPPDQALHKWVDYYGAWLADAGYWLEEQRPERVEFLGRYRPRWEVAVALFLFPVGLIALLGSIPAHLDVTTTAAGVSAEGKVHRRIAKELEKDAAEARRSAVPAAS
jgi:hypothetical protein